MPKQEQEWVRQNEYAFWRGVEDATIATKIRDKTLPDHVRKKVGGKVFIEKIEADRILDNIDKRRDARKAEKNLGAQAVEVEVDGKKVTVDASKVTLVKPAAESEADKYYRLKAQKEEVALELNKTKLGEQRGKLIKADSIVKIVGKAFNDTKEQLLNIPDQMGPELLACTDLVDLQTKLTEAINKALLSSVELVKKYKQQGEDNNE